MIGPWPWPIDWIARGAALAVASGIVYLLARRAGPRAGVVAAAWGLGLLAALPALLLLPGPRWELPIGPPPSRPPEPVGLDPIAIEGRGPIVMPIDGPGIVPVGDAPESTAVEGPVGERSPSRVGPIPAPGRALPAEDRTRREWPWREGIAVGLAALVGLGIARFAVGLWAVDRVRGRSRPIVEESLVDLLDTLRAELSLARAVGLRETTELDTPATLGWRRPVVLLPDDWRAWDAAELRAVLAHELAHVRGLDYPAALLARLGVALHPYNPMVHWLSARLRLDQELDADAAAARLSGGRQAYLSCLARLALRRDDRGAGWPARAFLPVRETFVRRIEMLRHDRSPDRDGPSRRFRALTVASIAAAALLCTGLRGPAPEAAGALPQEDPPIAGSQAPPADLGADEFDLSAVPQDAAFVLAIKTARLAAQPDLRPLFEEFNPLGRIIGGAELPIAGLQQLTLVELRRQELPDRRGPAFLTPDLLIFRTVDPLVEGIVGQILGDSEAVAFLGTTYHRARGGGAATFRIDDRTLVVAPREQTIRYLIAGRNRPPGTSLWTEAADRVGDGQVLVAFETPWLVRLLSPMGPDAGGPLDDPIGLLGPMLDRAYAYAVGVDVIGASVDAIALCADEEGAGRVAETASALKTLGGNALGALRSREATDPDAAGAIGAVEAILGSAAIEAEGATVRLRAEPGLDLAEILRLAAPAIASARIAGLQDKATTNLKQIGLAMHNYHDTHGAFPPPVLFSEDGTPYSWRVAILPYMEQMQLYDQYRFDEPWDGPNNRALLERMPAVYDVPGSDNDPTHADYFALVGPSTLMGEPGKGTSISDIRDGTSNTLMIVESKRPVPWTKPEDIPVPDYRSDWNAPPPDLGGFWREGVQVVFGDGSVRLLSATIDPPTLRALITRDGGEVISSDALNRDPRGGF